MNTKRFLISILVLFVALFGQSGAQNTSTTATVFSLVDSLISKGLLRAPKSSPYFMADNRGSATHLPVSVVTAWSTNASADSAWSYSLSTKRYWQLTLTTLTRADSLALFALREYNSGGILKATYAQYVNYGTVKKQGANWYKGAAHNEANFGSTPLGLNLTMCTYATLLQSVGWNWYLYLWDEQLVNISNSGAIAYYSIPSLDSLTILSSGTINRTADTISTSAFGGQYATNGIFFKAKGVHPASDSVRFGYGVILKNNALGMWCPPLGAAWVRVSVISDSVFMAPLVDSTAFAPITLPAKADSAIIRFWGKSAKDSLTIGPVKLGRRD